MKQVWQVENDQIAQNKTGMASWKLSDCTEQNRYDKLKIISFTSQKGNVNSPYREAGPTYISTSFIHLYRSSELTI